MKTSAFNDSIFASFPRSNFCGMSLPDSTHFFLCRSRSSWHRCAFSFNRLNCGAFIFNAR